MALISEKFISWQAILLEYKMAPFVFYCFSILSLFQLNQNSYIELLKLQQVKATSWHLTTYILFWPIKQIIIYVLILFNLVAKLFMERNGNLHYVTIFLCIAFYRKIYECAILPINVFMTSCYIILFHYIISHTVSFKWNIIWFVAYKIRLRGKNSVW